MDKRPLLTPGSLKGFMSARAPLSLPPGYASSIFDARLDDGTARVRWGSIGVNGAINGTQTFRGCYECAFNGTPTIFVGTSNGSKVSILRSVDHGVTFTEISASPTRLNDVGPVYFGLVENRGTELLIVQNGTDYPRIWDGTSFTIADPTQPAPSGSVLLDFLSYEAFIGVTNADIVNTNPGNLAATMVTNGIFPYLSVFVDYSVVGATDTATIDVSGSTSNLVNPAVPTQFAFLIDSFNEDAIALGNDPKDETQGWRNLKIEASTVGTSGPWTTLYEPGATPIVTADSFDTAKLVGVKDFGTLPAGPILAYRISWVGARPSGGYDLTIPIYTLAATGYEPGGVNFGLAYGSDYTEGAGKALAVPTEEPHFAGMPAPISSLFNYVYRIEYANPATLGSFDTLNLYRNDLGTTGYYFVDSAAVTPSSTGFFSDGDVSPLPEVDFSRPMPSATAIPLPVGTDMETINDRLFLCSGSRLYYSEAGSPLLFSREVRFDGTQPVADSGGSFSKPGETFQRVIGVGQVLTSSESLGTPQSGAVSVYCLTDRKTYVLSGFDALSLNKTTPICEGTRSPFSVARGESGGFAFLDAKNQVRKVQGISSAALSKSTVDDQLASVPNARLQWAQGACLDERYYLAYSPSGSLNTRILVYNEGLGFESIDRPLVASQGLLPYYDPALSRTRLLSFGQTTLSEHAAPNRTLETDNSRPIMEIAFPELSFVVNGTNVGNGFVLTDVDASGTASMSLECAAGIAAATVPYGPTSLAGAKVGDTKAGKSFAGGKGASTIAVRATIQIQALGGTRLYRYEIETSVAPDSYRK